MSAQRGRYSDPVENVASYIMVHGGHDRHERLLDVEWIRSIIGAAREVDNQFDRTSPEFHRSVDALKEALRATFR